MVFRGDEVAIFDVRQVRTREIKRVFRKMGGAALMNSGLADCSGRCFEAWQCLFDDMHIFVLNRCDEARRDERRPLLLRGSGGLLFEVELVANLACESDGGGCVGL